MRTITLRQFAEKCGGKLYHVDPATSITGFAIDSKNAQPGRVFIAIKGARTDGHLYVEEAFEAGAIAALVEKPVAGPHILVVDVVQALAQFAASQRDTFTGPVIGVTGSYGKTSTKELIAAALSPLGPILKSIGNKNTEYTAPLLWGSLEPEHKGVVAELAMRGFGQIAHLASFTKPTLGVITAIGTSHLELLGSREGIARAKAELLETLPQDGTAILWEEDGFKDFLSKKAPCRVRTFGYSEGAECRVLGYKAIDWGKSCVLLYLKGQSIEAELPIVGRHQAANAAAALLVADTLGVDLHRAAEQLAKATFPPNRMQVIQLEDKTVVLDAYNANPDTVEAAIRTLAEVPTKGKRYVILGEMVELGELSELGHGKVGRALAEYSPDGVLLYGAMVRHTYEEALRAGYPENSILLTQDFSEIRAYLDRLKEGDVVLMKASRAVGLERALEAEGLAAGL